MPWERWLRDDSTFVNPKELANLPSGESWMYPDPNAPIWEIPVESPYVVGIYGLFHPQQSFENTTHTMGTHTWGVHLSLSLDTYCWSYNGFIYIYTHAVYLQNDGVLIRNSPQHERWHPTHPSPASFFQMPINSGNKNSLYGFPTKHVIKKRSRLLIWGHTRDIR